MAITLVADALPARTTRQGSDTFTVTAGQRVTIETAPRGIEVLDAVVPAGKTWTVTVNVYVVET